MARDFADILDECLRELNRGEVDVETCLRLYPEHASRLQPLLRTAMLVREVSHPLLPWKSNVVGRQRLLQAVAEKRQRAERNLRHELGQKLGAFLQVLRPPAGARWATAKALSAALVLAVVLASLGTVKAAAGSLPGSPFYPVKLATEELQLALAPTAASKARLHVCFAERRLGEIEAQAELGQGLDVAILQAMRRENARALAAMGKIPAEEVQPLLAGFIALAEKQQMTLERVKVAASPPVQEAVDQAIEDSQQKTQLAKKAMENPSLLVPSPTPPPIVMEPTLSPTPTAEPTKAPKPTITATPQPTPTDGPEVLAPTVEPTLLPTATGMPRAEPSPTPTCTATPEVEQPTLEPTLLLPTPTESPAAEPSPTPTCTATPEVEQPTLEPTLLLPTPTESPAAEPSPTVTPAPMESR